MFCILQEMYSISVKWLYVVHWRWQATWEFMRKLIGPAVFWSKPEEALWSPTRIRISMRINPDLMKLGAHSGLG